MISCGSTRLCFAWLYEHAVRDFVYMTITIERLGRVTLSGMRAALGVLWAFDAKRDAREVWDIAIFCRVRFWGPLATIAILMNQYQRTELSNEQPWLFASILKVNTPSSAPCRPRKVLLPSSRL